MTTVPYIDNAKVLLNNIITLQSTNVDAVSGATYSSAGLIEAVRNALQGAATGGGTAVSRTCDHCAGKDDCTGRDTAGKFPYPDGVYKGSGEGYRGETHLQLTLKSGTITKIEVLDTEDDAAFSSVPRR
ncbi:MAG: FMN-binding protein [Ruminococcus sp.]